ncbi:MAG: hypothetical protein QXY73_02135 [Candidatus Bathyarchaeia archaeon]
MPTQCFRGCGGKWEEVVERPFNCVVFCTACEKVCPIPGALTFPSKTEVSNMINKLREETIKGR